MWGGIGLWGDGQAGPCMGGAWHRCMVWCLDGVCWIGEVGPEHWGLVLDDVW